MACHIREGLGAVQQPQEAKGRPGGFQGAPGPQRPIHHPPYGSSRTPRYAAGLAPQDWDGPGRMNLRWGAVQQPQEAKGAQVAATWTRSWVGASGLDA